jgi:septation ring formation regulator EzrA
MLGVATKFIGELIEWFYTKLRKYFNHQNDRDRAHSEITDGLSEIKDIVNQLKDSSEKLNERVTSLEKQATLTTERLQENSKSYIIDKHHYFFYQVGAIDDLNLQSLERRYLYYKSAGGDSYIDNLMEEIRELPKVNLQNQNIVSAIHSAREQ